MSKYGRLIDADALIPMIKYATTDSEIGVFPIKIGFDAIVKVINDAPTIEPEIIRCKDCKHRYEEDGCPMRHVEWAEYDDDGYLELQDIIWDYTEDESFCSWGERS